MRDKLLPPKAVHLFQALLPQVRQVILVQQQAAGSTLAQVTTWEQGEGWLQALEPMVASLGRAGVVGAVDKIEGDGCTPAGIYSLGLVFGSELTVATAMPYRQATAEDVWVDDPAAVSYNTWVKGPLAGYSAEQLLRADGLYRYVIVIEYNTRPVVCGKGSAIFIHPWLEDLRPTAGCVALAEDNLRRLLAWLEPTKAPTIILQQADSEGGH